MAKSFRKPTTLAERLARHEAAGLEAVDQFELAASKLERAADDLRLAAKEAEIEAGNYLGLAKQGHLAADRNLSAATKIRSLFDSLK